MYLILCINHQGNAGTLKRCYLVWEEVLIFRKGPKGTASTVRLCICSAAGVLYWVDQVSFASLLKEQNGSDRGFSIQFLLVSAERMPGTFDWPRIDLYP